MAARLTKFKRTIPFDTKTITGYVPRRRSQPLAARPSRKPRLQPTMQRKPTAATYEQLAQEIVFLRSHVAALVKENEALMEKMAAVKKPSATTEKLLHLVPKPKTRAA